MSGGSSSRSVARFFGGLLIAIGVLIAATAGLCSLVVTTMGVIAAGSHVNDLLDEIPMVLGVGGIPFFIGLALFFVGRRVFRGPAPRDPADPRPEP